MSGAVLPALTLPDPMVSGEGALDPLGLANVGERLAEELLPGVRARMNRVRYVTAIAVSAAVVDGLEDRLAADGVTSPQLVFEWLLVEGLVRVAERGSYRGTPGINKAAEIIERNTSMSAKTYLKAPTVFGFHGVYKPLAQDLEVVDRDMRLLENGRDLVDVWERQQGLAGFLDRAVALPGQAGLKQVLRSAVETTLEKGFVEKSSGWQGRRFFAEHLVPSGIGEKEAERLWKLLVRAEGGTRGEIMERMAGVADSDLSEADLARTRLRPGGSQVLNKRLDAIEAYERFCAVVEGAFDWIRHRSMDPLRALTREAFGRDSSAAKLSKELQPALVQADRSIAECSLALQKEFHDVVSDFNGCRAPEELFEATLTRHHAVQSRKPPNGKRDWFERTSSGDVIVRAPYRRIDLHEPGDWPRPYRISTALRFSRDLKRAGRGRA